MSEFHFSEGAFELPMADVVDKSATALEITVGAGQRATLVLTRDALGEQTLREVLDKSLELLGVTMRRFQHEPPVALKVGGVHEAFEFEMTWRHDAGPMFHRVGLIAYDGKVLTLTVAAGIELKGQVRKVFDAVLQSMKFRRKK